MRLISAIASSGRGPTELILVVIDCYNDVYAVSLGFTGFPRVLQYPVVIQ